MRERRSRLAARPLTVWSCASSSATVVSQVIRTLGIGVGGRGQAPLNTHLRQMAGWKAKDCFLTNWTEGVGGGEVGHLAT